MDVYHLRRKQQAPITIFSVYQVNIRPTNEIGTTAWHQQRILLNQKDRSNQHPRQAFIQDMIQQIQNFQDKNHNILIGGDFNETATKSNSGLLKLMTTTGLIDPWTQRFPTHPNFNTYRRGTNRIDTIICSPTILPMVRSLGYSPFNWFTNSDHRAVVIELSSNTLFNEPDDLSHLSTQQRSIRSNDKIRAQTYINQCYKHLMENNAEILVSRIENHQATTDDVKTYDKLITQGSKSAKKSCRKQRPEFYSNKINSLRIRTSIALGHLNQLRKYNQYNIHGFQSRLKRADTMIEFKDDPQEAYQVFKTLRLAINEIP